MSEPVTEPSRLDQALLRLDLPVRTMNWAERTGIRTVRELLAWSPDSFAQERNVGRRTVRETRERLEAHLGCTWEEAYAAVQGVPNAETETADDAIRDALAEGRPALWAHLAATLTEEERSIPLADLDLPTRMKNFARAEGITRVGELLGFSYEALMERPNIGRTSLKDALEALRERLIRSGRALSTAPEPPSAPCTTFLEAWHRELSALERIPRMVVTRRAGVFGNREKLEELGAMLGVSRERVRQIEARVLESLRERPRFRGPLEEHLASAFGDAKVVLLKTVLTNPWWAGVDQNELVLDYLLQRVVGEELYLFTGPSGHRYLSKIPEGALEESIKAARAQLSNLEYPVELDVVESILRAQAASLDPALIAELEHALGPLLLRDPQAPTRITGFGQYRENEVIAFLNAQPAPVPIAVLVEQFGRGQLPEEVLYFKRGVVGLKRHFPDFDDWMAHLVPAAIDVMNQRPAGRQWLVPEIHEVLAERGLIPGWLGHWHLASLLRLSQQVNYLGRLRVALKDSGQERRIEYEDLLEELLKEAGTPLPLEELLARARQHTDVSNAASLIVREAPFVRLDEERIGLIERDIPGGPDAVAAAVEAVVQRLNATEVGLTPFQATELVRSLSEAHSSWTQELVTSLLRSEPSLRIGRSRNIGLDTWDDARFPARAEFIRREVQRAGGALALDALTEKLAAIYGSVPDRSTLGVLAREEGLTIDDAGFLRRAPDLSEPPASRTAFNLSGIPAELREMFSELTREPFWDLTELREQVDEHVAAVESEHQVNEFVDAEGARSLGRQSHQLIERWDSLSLPDRQLAHAAIRYFVSWHDVENDLDIGGLDDDKAIMKAVFAHLGLEAQT